MLLDQFSWCGGSHDATSVKRQMCGNNRVVGPSREHLLCTLRSRKGRSAGLSHSPRHQIRLLYVTVHQCTVQLSTATLRDSAKRRPQDSCSKVRIEKEDQTPVERNTPPQWVGAGLLFGSPRTQGSHDVGRGP